MPVSGLVFDARPIRGVTTVAPLNCPRRYEADGTGGAKLGKFLAEISVFYAPYPGSNEFVSLGTPPWMNKAYS